MTKKYGFLKFELDEFLTWIKEKKIARTVLTVQQHHTLIPAYGHFNGSNHFDLQKRMKNHHMGPNGWMDIGQHITIFPDGVVMTGRSFEYSPACIKYRNKSAFCIENLGNFDKGKDKMDDRQKTSIIKVTAALVDKFGLGLNSKDIVYHHWFDLGDGKRTGGFTGSVKSCPGSNFFKGNKEEHFEKHFLPLVKAEYEKIKGLSTGAELIKYAEVNADILEVREGPHYTKPKARAPLPFGAVVRVFDVSDNKWYKISSKEERWISGRYTEDVFKATLKIDLPTHFLNEGDVLFVKKIDENHYSDNRFFDKIHKDNLAFS